MKRRLVIDRAVGVAAVGLMIGVGALVVASQKERRAAQREVASSPKQTKVEQMVVYKSPT